MASSDGSFDAVSAPPSDATRTSEATARFGGASSEEAALVSIFAADAMASAAADGREEALNSSNNPDARAGKSPRREGLANVSSDPDATAGESQRR